MAEVLGIWDSNGQSLDRRCQVNLMEIGIALRMYSESDVLGRYPPLSPVPGRLWIDENHNYLEIIPDLTVNVCPLHPDTQQFQLLGDTWRNPSEEAIEAWFNDTSYFYLGYVVRDDSDVAIFAEGYLRTLKGEGNFEDDLRYRLPNGNSIVSGFSGYVAFRLSEQAARYGVGDHASPAEYERARERIPIVIERPGNHERPGGNVLYLDGHVEFIQYPGKWPMTEKTIGILNELDALGHNPRAN